MASKDIVVKHNKLSSERIPTMSFPVVAFVTTAKPYDLETCMYGLTEGRGLRNPFLLSFTKVKQYCNGQDDDWQFVNEDLSPNPSPTRRGE